MTSEELKRTPLYGKHLELGAKMAPFAGWEMPIQYTEGILSEHIHTRTAAAVFDICHMGEFRIKGADAAKALDGILARAVLDQKTGVCRYNFLLTEKGTVIDDLIVYRIGNDEFFIVVNASTRNIDAARFKELLPPSVSFTDESDKTAKIDLQGPLTFDVLKKIGIKKETIPPYYNWTNMNIAGISCLLSRTGYTGELGVEIYTDSGNAEAIWDFLLAQDPVKPAGLGARDTLRLEMGYPLYGHELNLETTPIEAGFLHILKLDSGRTFVGSDALRNSRPGKKLVGIELDGRRAAREGTEIACSGKTIGIVTSGAFSPILRKSVAMAYLNSDFNAETGTELDFLVSRNIIRGTIVPIPFYRNGSARK